MLNDITSKLRSKESDHWFMILADEPAKPALQSILRISGGVFSQLTDSALVLSELQLVVLTVPHSLMGFEQGLKALRVFSQQIDPTFSFLATQDFALPELCFFDMDGTLIEQESIVELARMAGVEEKVSEITEQAMKGELDFSKALAERVALLKGLKSSEVEKASELLELHEGVQSLLQKLGEAKVGCYLVSGGFHELADSLVEHHQLKFERVLANTLTSQNGELTGETLGPVIDGKAKAELVKSVRKTPSQHCWAVGDGANDKAMFEETRFGIGFSPKPALIEKSHAVNRTGSHKFLQNFLVLLLELN